MLFNFAELLTIFKIIYLFIVCLAFFLSLWVIIPAPNLFFIRLSVGIPELSPWLIVIHLLSFAFGLAYFQTNLWFQLSILANLIGLGLSLLPLIHFSRVNLHWQQEIKAKLGRDYLQNIPESIKTKMRSKPLIIKDLFTGIPQPQVRIERGISFAQLDKISLKLNVYKPFFVGKYPCIIVIYGGAWQNGSPHENEPFSLYMANQGYTVIAIDYRHAPQYRFPTQLNDVHLALQYIKDHAVDLEIDLHRMAIMGRSAGGQLALLSGYQNDVIKFRAVVDYYSPINLPHAYRYLPFPDPINTRAILESYIGDNPDNLPDLYQQASPINYVKKNLPPTLLIYPQRDHIVQAAAGRKMAQKLTDSGNCAVFLEINWADHAFDTVFFGISNQLALYYTERFLASILRQ